MIRLVGVEIRRCLARRSARALTLLFVAAFLIAGTVVFFNSSNPGSAEMEARLTQEEERIEACVRGEVTPDFAEPGFSVEEIPASERENFCRFSGSEPVGDPRFHLREAQGILEGISPFFIMIGWVMGASFMGAEWSHRTITTTLTWESRRTLVLASKAVATVVVIIGGALLLQALLVVLLMPAALLRGTTNGIDVQELLTAAGRVAAAAGVGGVIGFSIATVGRNTAAAVGVGFAYLAVLENLIRAWKPNLSKFLLGDNAAVFVTGDSTQLSCGFDQLSCGLEHSTLDAGGLLLIYALGLFLIALMFFTRRDVA